MSQQSKSTSIHQVKMQKHKPSKSLRVDVSVLVMGRETTGVDQVLEVAECTKVQLFSLFLLISAWPANQQHQLPHFNRHSSACSVSFDGYGMSLQFILGVAMGEALCICVFNSIKYIHPHTQSGSCHQRWMLKLFFYISCRNLQTVRKNCWMCLFIQCM